MPDADMMLPEGMTCRDCYQWKRCEGFLSLNGSETSCDWAPSRFAPSMELVNRLKKKLARRQKTLDGLGLTEAVLKGIHGEEGGS